MAGGAAPLGNRRMLGFGLRDVIKDLLMQILMTAGAKLRHWFLQLITGHRAMGIMTVITVLFHWRMHLFHRELILAILMAAETELATCGGGDQQFLIMRGMRPMASDTVTSPHRAMHMILAEHVLLMTGKTKAADRTGFAYQLKTPGRLMRVMAVYTAFLDRRMHDFLGKLLFFRLMTDKAEIASLTLHLAGTSRAMRVMA